MEAQSATSQSSRYSSESSHHHPRACAICARAKAKCVPGDGSTCQRCSRLKKHCEPVHAQPRSQPRKRKPAQPVRPQKSQVEKLGEKLDGLVSLLQATQQSTIAPEVPLPIQPSVPLNSLLPQESSSIERDPIHSTMPAQHWAPPVVENSNTHPLTPTTLPTDTQARPLEMKPIFESVPDRVFAENVEFTDEEASNLLKKFRSQMIPFFPFVVISPSISAQDLRRDRPFFLKAICAVASSRRSQKLNFGKWLVEHLAERMAVNLERNLDLLLGALTFAGWSLLNCPNTPPLTLLLSLCMTLTYDLSLNKPIPMATQKVSLERALSRPIHPASISRDLPVKVDVKRTVEERRAFLGVFFLISSASRSSAVNIESPRITPYVYECAEILNSTQDQPNDISATCMIQLQLIVERINQAPWNSDHGNPEDQSSRPPPKLYMKSLQEQLYNFRRTMPTNVSMQGYMLIHYYHAEELLYGIGLSKDSKVGSIYDHSFDRMETLYNCLRSTRRLWETFFCIPEYRYGSFSTVLWMHISHSFITLHLLSTFDHQDWHLPSIRQEIDFGDVLDKLIERLSQAEGDVFDKALHKLSTIRSRIRDQFAADHEHSQTASITGHDADFGRTWEQRDILDAELFGDFFSGMEF